MITLKEMIEIRDDYVKTYLRITSEHGICKKSNEYAEKIDKIENLIENFKGENDLEIIYEEVEEKIINPGFESEKNYE